MTLAKAGRRSAKADPGRRGARRPRRAHARGRRRHGQGGFGQGAREGRPRARGGRDAGAAPLPARERGGSARRALATVIDVLTGGARWTRARAPRAAPASAPGRRSAWRRAGSPPSRSTRTAPTSGSTSSMPLFGSGGDPAALKELVAFSEEVGGPEGRCSRFDASPVVSVCLDPERMGELGATDGYGKIAQGALRRLRRPEGDPEDRRAGLRRGPAEPLARRAGAQARRRRHPRGHRAGQAGPLRRVVGPDGRLARRRREGVRRRGDAPPAMRRSRSSCRAPRGGRRSGKGFDDRKKVVTAFEEAGWSAYLIAAAGTWPKPARRDRGRARAGPRDRPRLPCVRPIRRRAARPRVRDPEMTARLAGA